MKLASQLSSSPYMTSTECIDQCYQAAEKKGFVTRALDRVCGYDREARVERDIAARLDCFLTGRSQRVDEPEPYRRLMLKNLQMLGASDRVFYSVCDQLGAKAPAAQPLYAKARSFVAYPFDEQYAQHEAAQQKKLSAWVFDGAFSVAAQLAGISREDYVENVEYFVTRTPYTFMMSELALKLFSDKELDVLLEDPNREAIREGDLLFRRLILTGDALEQTLLLPDVKALATAVPAERDADYDRLIAALRLEKSMAPTLKAKAQRAKLSASEEEMGLIFRNYMTSIEPWIRRCYAGVNLTAAETYLADFRTKLLVDTWSVESTKQAEALRSLCGEKIVKRVVGTIMGDSQSRRF